MAVAASIPLVMTPRCRRQVVLPMHGTRRCRLAQATVLRGLLRLNYQGMAVVAVTRHWRRTMTHLRRRCTGSMPTTHSHGPGHRLHLVGR